MIGMKVILAHQNLGFKGDVRLRATVVALILGVISLVGCGGTSTRSTAAPRLQVVTVQGGARPSHETPPATQTGQFEGTFTGPEEEERAERERNKARNGATR
ncbi:MAG TPA: hypothetical protein VH115_06700 [Solirubrobacteraceae bacterium]|nr:hypothetical protein [Solirubrobacteraceae bacterium]